MKYLIQWQNSEVYSLSQFSSTGITYIASDFLVTSDLVAAKTGLEALGINCLLIENEINNPSIIQI